MKIERKLVLAAAGGLTYLLIFFLVPGIGSYFGTPDGFVWSPLTDQYRQCSDARAYYSGIKETKEEFWTIRNPVSNETSKFQFEKVRWASYRLTSMLTFSLSDDRLAFTVSYLVGILLTFLLCYFCFVSLSIPVWVSSGFSLLVMIYYKAVTILFLSGPQWAWEYVSSGLLNRSGHQWFEGMNDSFRYLALSSSYIFLWLLLLSLHIFLVHKKKWSQILLIAASGILPLVYPPLFVLGAGLLFVSAISYLYLNQKTFDRAVLMSGITILFIWATLGFGYIDIFHLMKSGSPMSSHIAGKSAFSLSSALTFCKFGLFCVLPLLLCRTCNQETKMIVRSGSIAVFMIGLIFFSFGFIELLERFLFRGFAHFLTFLLFTAGYYFVVERTLRFRTIFLKAVGLLFVILLIVPIVGSARMVRPFIEGQVFYLEQSRWELYQFLNQKRFENKQALSFDFEDMQLLPDYTDLNLYLVTGEYLGDPGHEFALFQNSARGLGVPLGQLNSWLDHYDEQGQKFGCSPSKNGIPSKESLRGFLTLKQLLYEPYLNDFRGIPMRLQGGVLNTKFLTLAKSMMETPVELKFLNEVDLIILRKSFGLNHEEALKNLNAYQFRRIYDNQDFEVFAKSVEGP